nr:PatB family C-S lyase [Pleionea sp. CnH1-48]
MLTSIYGTSDITPFWVADMDFKVAEPIQQELRRLAERGQFAYEFDDQKVYEALVGWYQRRHNIDLKPEQFAQVPGVLTGIALLIRELSEPGEGILIQTPVYHQFKHLITKANRNLIESPLRIDNGHYRMDFDDLAAKFRSGNVRAMLLCNPHNPVGRVWTKDELEALVQLANQYNVILISDEIHSDIIYSKHAFTSIASYSQQGHVALLGSPAKTFGMQSISNGYIYTLNLERLEQVKAVVDAMYLGHGNAFSTYAAIAAYTKGDEWLDELLTYLKNTLGWIQTFVETKLPLVSLYPVEGTYQVWMNFENLGLTTDEVKEKLIAAKMGLTPGAWFGADSDYFYRMNIASPLSVIQARFRELERQLD